jgi:polysaccharide export outer membrane protein
MLKRFIFAIMAAASVALGAPIAAAQTNVPAASGPAYYINPGDELQVSVWGEERLQRSVAVLPDGTFAFPLVGQIIAANRLPSEIETAIQEGLRPQYRGDPPRVTVSVTSAKGYAFSVIGKVRSPGTFTPGRYVNALEALSLAGGPSEFAQVRGIRIIRKQGSQLRAVRVQLGDTLSGNSERMSDTEIPAIQSGDTVVVP